MSTVKADTLLAQSGNPVDPVSIPGLDRQFAKSWVLFDGTGTPSVTDSFNISSVTDNGVGDYTANFTTPLNGADYAALASSNFNGALTTNRTANGYNILNFTGSDTPADSAFMSSAVFGN